MAAIEHYLSKEVTGVKVWRKLEPIGYHTTNTLAITEELALRNRELIYETYQWIYFSFGYTPEVQIKTHMDHAAACCHAVVVFGLQSAADATLFHLRWQ